MSSNDINEIVFDVYGELVKRFTPNKPRKRILGTFLRICRMITDNPRYLFCSYGRSILFVKEKNVPLSKGLNNFAPTSQKFPDTKIAVYTVITGSYDNLKRPLYVDDSIDYYAVTDAASVVSAWGGGGGIISECFLFPNTSAASPA